MPEPASAELVHYDVADRIATITLDSPSNRNALSVALVDQLQAHLASAAADAGVRAVVLAHTGTTFCAGADLREQSEAGGPERGTERLVALLRAIVMLERPVLARVSGHTRAGGIGLLGACDVVVSGPVSTFALTEVRLGLAPAIISLTVQPRMGERSFARYALTGEVFGPDAAVDSGLVTVVAEDPDAEIAALCTALRLCSPQGLAETKRLATTGVRARLDACAADMQTLSQRLFASPEAAEGMQSFLARRPPRWASPD